jgi:hypothetical protein
MLNFAKIADPDFEAFVHTYNLPHFVELKRVCEVVNIGRTKLYELHGKGKLVIRNIEGKRGVFATDIFQLFKDAPSITGRG